MDASQDFYNNALTITPVFTASALQDSIKVEPSIHQNDFDDFSSWVKCEFCEYRCPKKDRLSRHVRNVHYKEKPFHCPHCDACFGRKDKMKRHIATVHSSERPYKCDFCNHSSGRKDKIREHIQSVHLKNRKPKKKYPKKTEKPANTAQVELPQHPLPRHELNPGVHTNSGLVTLTPVSFVPQSFQLAPEMMPNFHHVQPVVTIANPQSIYRLIS